MISQRAGGLKSYLFFSMSIYSPSPTLSLFLPADLAAVLAVLRVHLGAFVNVLQRVRSLYRQLGGVHGGQLVLLGVQPGLLVGGVLLLPLGVVPASLVHTLHHPRSQTRGRSVYHPLWKKTFRVGL